MKHIKPITMVPGLATDLNSVYWIIVNFTNAGVALLDIFARLFQTISFNIANKGANE